MPKIPNNRKTQAETNPIYKARLRSVGGRRLAIRPNTIALSADKRISKNAKSATLGISEKAKVCPNMISILQSRNDRKVSPQSSPARSIFLSQPSRFQIAIRKSWLLQGSFRFQYTQEGYTSSVFLSVLT